MPNPMPSFYEDQRSIMNLFMANTRSPQQKNFLLSIHTYNLLLREIQPSSQAKGSINANRCLLLASSRSKMIILLFQGNRPGFVRHRLRATPQLRRGRNVRAPKERLVGNAHLPVVYLKDRYGPSATVTNLAVHTTSA